MAPPWDIQKQKKFSASPQPRPGALLLEPAGGSAPKRSPNSKFVTTPLSAYR